MKTVSTNTLPLFLILLFFTLCFSKTTVAAESEYHIEISFQPEERSLQAKARIRFPAGKKWRLFTGGLTVQKVTVQEAGKEPFHLPLPQGDSIGLYAGKLSQIVTVSYSLQVPESDYNNLISSRGIALTSGWHPIPDHAMQFSLRASLPSGFSGISESDTLPSQENGSFSTVFSQPVQAIHLVAGPYQVEKTAVREGLTLSTWFFMEDQELSQEYLDAAKTYILRYEEEIGPFPYSHYAIVSNRLPSGYGMPTFTLLGQVVLRLPFIKETSLGHEILHSWFGNSIEVAAGSGNWCEGLTSYLADFSYAADKGEGAAHRKAALTKYQNFVHTDNATTLQSFHSASHNQPMAKAARAVGYTRGAMLFHQLRGLLGPEHFTQAIRLFGTGFQGRSASWNDIQTVFETASGLDLATFFDQQLKRTDAPDFNLTQLSTTNDQDSSFIHFTVEQTSSSPYSLQLPIRVTGMAGEETFSRSISEKTTDITLPISGPPLSISLDPEYDLFRTLQTDEKAGVWSGFLGAANKLIIKGSAAETAKLAPFLQWAERQGWTLTDTVSNQQLAENSILFLGSDSPSFHSLFGSSEPAPEGFRLQVHKNPLNEHETAVLVTGSSSEETKAVLRKLSHYGKYSSLSFHKGKLLEKSINTTDQGQQYILEDLPKGGPTSNMNSFEQILNSLAEKRVIYLGETHNSLADHLLQLRIIQGLQAKGVELAVAMEMFPQSSQQILDNYVLKQTDMDEAAFLKESHWFKVWRYDWRLFRPIFNFCRAHKIPVFGINIERDIVSNVFAAGSTDKLSQEQQQTIASHRDLSMDGYVDRLRIVHGFHGQNPHGDSNGFAGFVQSQAIWDESMAENISTILQDNPQKTLLVIAGAQHTRKDSGIPPRLLRRIDVEQASVLNLYMDSPPTNLKQQVDFFFLAEPQFLEAKGKIGIVLKPEEENEIPQLRIIGISETGKAGQAGLAKEDILVSIASHPVQTMEDIGILMMNCKAGDKLQVTILRKNGAEDPEEKEFTVELSNLDAIAPHP